MSSRDVTRCTAVAARPLAATALPRRAARITPILAALLSTHAHADPTFYNLGLLPGGAESHGYALSHNGAVAGGEADSPAGVRAFLWTPTGGMQDIDPDSDWTGVVCCGIDIAGPICLGFGNNPAGELRAFRWTQFSGIQDLGTLLGGTFSLGYGMSASGQLIVGESDSPEGAYRPFLWHAPAGMLDLGTLPGSSVGGAYAISADGFTVVGYSDHPLGGQRAVRWTGFGAEIQDLGTLPGGNLSAANGANADGSVIVGYSNSPAGDRAFRWKQSTGMRSLGLPPGWTRAYAYSATADGSAVVGDGSGAFLWTAATGIMDLETYFTSLGIDLTGWELIGASTIAADADGVTTIVGTGWLDGLTRAWVVTGLPAICRADFITDGIIDFLDYLEFLNLFDALDPRADFNEDGIVDFTDYLEFLNHFDKGC